MKHSYFICEIFINYYKLNWFLIFIRYAIQLLTPSSQNAKMNGHGSILRKDIEETTSLFMHAKESCKILKKCADKFMK